MLPGKLHFLSSINRYSFYLILFSVFFVFSTCTKGVRRSFLPAIPGYDETKKEVLVLDKQLLEISGMFFMKDGRIAVNNDEYGRIYFLNPKDGSYDIFKFGSKADYEDIVQVDSMFYILESKGNLHRVKGTDVTTYQEFNFPKKKIEFESLYYDKKINKLVLVSKDHNAERPGILSYSFDLATETYSDSVHYFIPMKKIFFALKDNLAECKPSAAAVHPVTGKIFMIASIGQVILQCTPDGQVEQGYEINPSQFPQPEGITFAPNGDMYISNEGLNGKATLFKFPYQK